MDGVISNQWMQTLGKNLALPVPIIIQNMAFLTSASMQQLDTAFRHTTESASEYFNETTSVNSPSPVIIEYPQSFRTTLLQISQMLSNTLRTAWLNAENMSILSKAAKINIDSAQRYLPLYQNSSRYSDLLLSPLNKLMESSKEKVQLATSAVAEFQRVANLTKNVFNVVLVSADAKMKQLNSTRTSILKQNAENTRLLGEKKEKIRSFNTTEGILRQNTTQWEYTFNTQLDLVLDMLKKVEAGKPCIQDFLADSVKKNRSVETTWAFQGGCLIRYHLDEVRERHNKLPQIKNYWKGSLKQLEEIDNDLRKLREEHHQIHLSLVKLDEEKLRLEKDISLLEKSSSPLRQVRVEMNNVIDGWKKLANFCNKDIKGSISKIMSTLNIRPGNSKLNWPISNDSLKSVSSQLEKTEDDMRLVDRETGVFVRAYNRHLADLASQLERMMTIKDADAMVLLDQLKHASNVASEEIRESKF